MENRYMQIHHSIEVFPKETLNNLLPHGTMAILYIHKGNTSLRFEDTEITLRSGTLAFLPPGVVFDIAEVSVIDLLVFDPESALAGLPFAGSPDIISTFSNGFAHKFINEREVRTISFLMEWLGRQHLENAGGFFRNDILQLCFYLLLYQALDLLEIPVRLGNMKSKERLFRRFFEKVPAYCREEHSVRFYADALFVTPGYLSRAVRTFTGRSAKHFIEMALLNEAYHLLANHELSIGAVADTLHFSSIASFSQFFKKYSGMSPKSYRLKNGHDIQAFS
jgi:AraC family transcriptional activator of pobA